MSQTDAAWLDRAVALATPMLGTTAENPTVGAVLTDPKGTIFLAEAVTAPGGRPHAEPQALIAAGDAARGATLYVTLEPCNHFGRTPPCCDAVIAAGVKRVVVGMVDPDPRTAGKSIERLRQAGIEVSVLDHRPSQRLHEGFVSRVTRGRPFVIAKLAVSADSMIGSPGVPNVQITGALSRTFTHQQRALSDAVVVGGRTANVDNPRLSVRLPDLAERKPLRVVLAGNEPLRTDLGLFVSDSSQPTVIIGTSSTVAPAVSTIWRVEGGTRPDLPAALQRLGQAGINRLFVEGGSVLTSSFLSGNLVDRFLLLTSPVVVGPEGLPAVPDGDMATRLAQAGLVEVDQRPLGDDMLRVFERDS